MFFCILPFMTVKTVARTKENTPFESTAARDELITIQRKWQKRWAEGKVFEANPDPKKKKFFVTFPYPYVNGLPHIGHLFTIMRVEAMARYKRLQGYNVLFPQGWHCTGSPIVNAAERIRKGEEKQTKIMKDMGFSDKDLKTFADPTAWVDYFPPEYKKDLSGMGLAIDWRREFITTDLNPHYDKFIRWQFNKLKDKEYIFKGKFPVVWCTSCNGAVSDHSRIEGEGEIAQEFTLLKFKHGDEYVVAATLRPETVYGQTNLWVNPKILYAKANVDGEIWIISLDCAEKLKDQEHEIKIIGDVKGEDLIGKWVIAPGIDREIPILPASFCRPEKGTGIVTSVPADAPDDWMGLYDLKRSEETCKRWGLDYDMIQRIHPIPIIRTDLGDMAAVEICEQMGIKSQHERQKLDEAKKIVYKKGFYEGQMMSSCGEFAGMPVQAAKDAIKQKLLDGKSAHLFWELTGNVVCRCLTKSVVRIVADQWFINYADEGWKSETHRALDHLKLYPEKVRVQFDYVIDWLHRWACTREEGLGTRLPWDEKWLIESLSDSTIYMAYYTIAHKVKGIPIEHIDDAFFDYVLLNNDDVPLKVDKALADDLRREFNYWYPVDFRNSGKDLIQNHLAFFIFNHVAIFPKKHWPKGIGVNGWVTVDGEKMSKSLGNMIPVRVMANEYSADASRITILSGGEELDDPNWDTKFAESIVTKLIHLRDVATRWYGKGRADLQQIDWWAFSELNAIVRDATGNMEETRFRSAIQDIFFRMQRMQRWYLRRCNDNPNKDVMSKAIEAQLIMLSCFCPHICEEAWEGIGKDYLLVTACWPGYDEEKIIEDAEAKEDLIRCILSDISEVLRIIKNENPKKITIFVANAWKYILYEHLRDKMQKTRNPSELLQFCMTTDLKRHGADVQKIIPKLVKSGLPPRCLSQEQELEAIDDAKDFLSSTFNCEIDVASADDAEHPKAKNALPSKVAILIEE